MTPEALKEIRPFLDAANVDLKAFRDETYKKLCRARLQPVLDTIALMRKLGVWVEVTTLVVPGLNDSDAELGDIARFLASTDRESPGTSAAFTPITSTGTPRRRRWPPFDGRPGSAGKKGSGSFLYRQRVRGKRADRLPELPDETHPPGRVRGFGEPPGFEGRCPRCGEALPGVYVHSGAIPIPV